MLVFVGHTCGSEYKLHTVTANAKLMEKSANQLLKEGKIPAKADMHQFLQGLHESRHIPATMLDEFMERAIIDKIVVHPVVYCFQGCNARIKSFYLSPAKVFLEFMPVPMPNVAVLIQKEVLL